MKKTIYLIVIFLIISLLTVGCGKTINNKTSSPKIKAEETQEIQTSKTSAEESTNKDQNSNTNTQNEPVSGTIIGTVTDVSGSEIKVNASGEEKTINIGENKQNISKGDFVRIEKDKDKIYIDVTKESGKKEIKEGIDIFGILKEVNDKSITIDINGKQESYKVTDKTIMQKFGVTKEVSVYIKDKLIVGNWVRMLVNKNGEVSNIVY